MKNICFAYFADGKFIGWYADTFGSVGDCPKVYSYSERQIEVVMKNFSNKIAKIKETSFDEQKDKVEGLAALKLLVFEGEELLRGKEVELKIVECPIYDGPNPNFNEIAYKEQVNARSEKWKQFESLLELSEGPSPRRVKAVEVFKEFYPHPKCDNWIYADYNKVKEWAKKEPTEFLNV